MCRNENMPYEFHTKRKLINRYMQMIFDLILSIYNSTDKLKSIKKTIFYDNTLVRHIDFIKKKSYTFMEPMSKTWKKSRGKKSKTKLFSKQWPMVRMLKVVRWANFDGTQKNITFIDICIRKISEIYNYPVCK